jgi:hypothetical protein
MEDRRKNFERRNFLMSDKDIAEKAGVSPNTVRYWRQTGVLPFVKVGKYPRVWYSVFLQVFKKTGPNLAGVADTMPLADGDIRRQS